MRLLRERKARRGLGGARATRARAPTSNPLRALICGRAGLSRLLRMGPEASTSAAGRLATTDTWSNCSSGLDSLLLSPTTIRPAALRGMAAPIDALATPALLLHA